MNGGLSGTCQNFQTERQPGPQLHGAVCMAAQTLVLGPSSQLSGSERVGLHARASVSSSIKWVPRPLSYLPYRVF